MTRRYYISMVRVYGAVAGAIFAAACASAPRASAPRNAVLDDYPASVNGRTTVIYYDIQGRTYAELLAELRRLGPTTDGRRFFAEARSPMLWRWRIDRTGAAYCAIRDVTVSVNAQITLPRWTPPADADPALVKEWKRFIAALEQHEAGHKDISARAGRDIVRKLNSYSDICSMINTRANEIARGITDRAVLEQRQFDAATRHGLNEGALFSAPAVRDSAR